MGITVDDLKREIKGYNYEVLTGGIDEPALRAIEKAETWAKAKIIQAKGDYDEDDEIIRLAIIKRALYELYSSAENEAVAQDKKEDAMELLRARFGNAVDAAGYTAGQTVSQSPLATGAIRRAEGKCNRYSW